MAGDIFKCSKCDSKMTRGFIVDSDRHTSSLSSYHYSLWVEGEPKQEKGFFGGAIASLDISAQKKFVIRAARCEKCGFLDLYAV